MALQVKKMQKKSTFWKDPVVVVLAGLIVLVVVGGLLTLGSMLISGVIPFRNTPMTANEYDTAVYKFQTEQTKNPDAFTDLVFSLVAAGRMEEAKQELEAAKNVDFDVTQNQAILYCEAKIAMGEKKYDEALEKLKQVKSLLKKAYETELKSGGEEKNWAMATGMPLNHYNASLDMVTAYLAQEKDEEALKEINYYLKENKTDAGILLDRANLKLKLGDKKGAAEDYNIVLGFLPDDAEALAGLEKAEK